MPMETFFADSCTQRSALEGIEQFHEFVGVHLAELGVQGAEFSRGLGPARSERQETANRAK